MDGYHVFERHKLTAWAEGIDMQIISKLRPNSARMWDFVMGGNHNFTVDRAAVKLAQTLYPYYEESMKAQRGFLQRAVTNMVKEKELDTFIDFGSGLPTMGNVHEIVLALNPRARILYSDRDSIAVSFGKELLKDDPQVQYIYCDITESHTFFESSQVTHFIGSNHRVGIGLVGVFLYIPDDPLAEFLQRLYEWALPGSYIAVTSAGPRVSNISGVVEASQKLGLQFYSRSVKETENLMGPWNLTEEGIVPGFYWGLSSDSPQINSEIETLSYSFLAYK
ncbi:MAG: SAM-dependent methyltransferase [Theionarchaea archaeon]|nr:SAM-dependent methyltransferase [Theionarchaea archaeon]